MIKGFTAKNLLTGLIGLPIEDAYHIDCFQANKIIAVGDGVTRDCSNGVGVEKTLKGIVNTRLYYPRKQNPAWQVTELATATFPALIREFDVKDDNAAGKVVREGVNERLIGNYNSTYFPNPDYLANDLAGCTFAGVVQKKNMIYYAYISDCGIAIIGKNGEVVFKTEKQGPDKFKKDIELAVKARGGWGKAEARRFIRKEVRNNPNCPYSFGVLTGQKQASDYVRTGSFELKPGELVLVYSDGTEEIMFKKQNKNDGKEELNPDFSEKIRERDFKGLEKLCRRKIRTEGTLVLHLN